MITRFALTSVIAIVAAVSSLAADRPLKATDFTKYQECVTAATNEGGTADEMIKACRESAEIGIPGAQYAFGVGLLSRGQAGDRTSGIDWLQKAAASGNPAAAFALAGVLAQEESPATVERGRVLVRQAVCSGYPPAVSAFARQGVSPETIGCVRPAEEDFAGEWVADLKWVKIEPSVSGGPQLKLVFEGSAVRIFMKSGAEWREVKPGKFSVAHVEQTISVSVLDTGWDFDGKWIEAWTLQLLRTKTDEAAVTFLRTVNNPHVPSHLAFRTFSTLAEGKAVRTAR